MTTPNEPNGTTTTVDQSVELVNRLLKLPEETRLDLANLLLDSVREGFTSLEEADRQAKERIRQRIDDVMNGRVELLDWRESFDQIEKRFREKFPQRADT